MINKTLLLEFNNNVIFYFKRKLYSNVLEIKPYILNAYEFNLFKNGSILGSFQDVDSMFEMNDFKFVIGKTKKNNELKPELFFVHNLHADFFRTIIQKKQFLL